MKPLCTHFLTFLLNSIFCSAPPTEITLNYIVTEEFADIEPSTNETEYIIGMPCNRTCNKKLFNVKCDEQSKTCECENDYPVPLVRKNGCVPPIQLGDQCMYSESCVANDAYSTCIQVRYNAYCRCISGYHEVSAGRNSKPFCSKDILRIAQDLPALLIAVGGIAVFSAIICFVLKLFVGKSRRTRRPPITTRLLSSSEIAHVARSLHTPDRHTVYSRKGTQGVTVPTSRATAARAAAILLVSCQLPNERQGRKLSDHSSERRNTLLLQRSESSYPRSFSAKQFKRESDQKLARKRLQISNQPSVSCSESFPLRLPEAKPRSLSCDDVSDYKNTREEFHRICDSFMYDDSVTSLK